MLLNLAITSSIATVALAANYATYPQVPKTASINGFADPIYAKLPSCAQDCVKESTGNTPCPYWDAGCLCVMPQWSGEVAECIAKQCQGQQVASATSLAMSLCSSAGAEWMMPASISAELESAAGGAANAKATDDASQSGSGTRNSSSSAQSTDAQTSGTVSRTATPAPAKTSKSTSSSASSTSASQSAGAGAIIAAPVGLLGMMMMLFW